MKKSSFLLSIFTWLILASCVDSKYNLDDVDTGNITIGDEVILPFGKATVKLSDVINLDKTSNITEQGDKSYQAIFEGKFSALKPLSTNTPKRTNLQSVGKVTIDTKDLYNLFDGDVILSLDDPHLILKADITEASIDLQVNVVASYGEGANNARWDSEVFYVTRERPDIWIGLKPYTGDEYTFFEWSALPLILLNPPKTIELELLTEAPIGPVGFILAAELTPTKDFRATTVQRIENAFGESLIESLFSSGETTIYGEMKNTLPLDIKIVMSILDEHNNPIGVNILAQEVVGENDRVSFLISEKDMPKMVNARHLELEMELKGREAPASLKSDQTLEMELKIHKKGGVKI